MEYSSFEYLVQQGLHNLRANKLMSIASVGVLCACLMITGSASLLGANLNRVVDYLGEQNEAIVYLKDDITPEQDMAIAAALTKENNIERYKFVSKEDALKEEMGYLEQYSDLIASYSGSENPFPASYRVTIANLEQLGETSKFLASLQGVEEVSTSSDLVSTLLGLKKTVSVLGWGLVAVLCAVSFVVISNTIRLTVFARRKEINIMKFVGATDNFIRMPFLVEGIAIGLTSAAIAFSVVSLFYFGTLSLLGGTGANAWLQSIYFTLIPYSKVWYWLLLGFVGSGVAVGGIGSAASITKYLKV